MKKLKTDEEMQQKELDVVKKKIELSATLKQKLRTASHIINRLSRRCIVKHEIKVYDEGENIIIDVYLAPFLDDIRQLNAIEQVSSQLLFPMLAKEHENFDYLNFFDWEVVKAGNEEGSKCFIRFTIYQKPYVELFYCKKCNIVTTRTYGGSENIRHCANCGFLEYDKYEHRRISTEWKTI